MVGLAVIGALALLGLAVFGAVALLSGDDSDDDDRVAPVEAPVTSAPDPTESRAQLGEANDPTSDDRDGTEASDTADSPEDLTADAGDDELADDEAGVDEVGVDEVGVDEAGVDEAGVDEVGVDDGGTNDDDLGAAGEGVDPEADDANGDESGGDESPEQDSPADADESDAGESGDDGPPESKAVVRNGQIFLVGAVPTAEVGAEIEALAAEILGADNVINEYDVDADAGDPNLGNVTVEDTINFASNSSVILAEGEGLLEQGLALLTIRPAMTITIVGHTDARGSSEQNQLLSEQRAESVKQWFVDLGVDGDRLATRGAGADDPIAENSTEDGQRLNRRIQFFLENILGE